MLSGPMPLTLNILTNAYSLDILNYTLLLANKSPQPRLLNVHQHARDRRIYSDISMLYTTTTATETEYKLEEVGKYLWCKIDNVVKTGQVEIVYNDSRDKLVKTTTARIRNNSKPEIVVIAVAVKKG